MRLEGSLDAFSLPDIFALLSMTKKTGGLHLRRGDAHGVVWLASGALSGGSAAVGRNGLARRVVAAAAVDPATLRQAADRARAEQVGLVTALLRAGAVEDAVAHEVAAEYLVDVVFDLLRWPDGDFEFIVDEPDPDPVGVARPVEEVVAEAKRRIEEWRHAGEDIPAPDAVLHLAALTPDTVTLDRDQWSLMVLADGRRSVAEIVELSGRGEYAALRGLEELLRMGVLAAGTVAGSVVDERLAILAELEAAAVAPTSGPAASPSAGAAAAEEVSVPAAAREALVAAEVPAAEVPAATTQPAVTGAGRDLSRVTPQRPEPFRGDRLPAHPDGTPMPAPATVGALATAPDPAPAPSNQIERDPSVNKSLLLRLIAGVRGL